jgi:hypothetical protein
MNEFEFLDTTGSNGWLEAVGMARILTIGFKLQGTRYWAEQRIGGMMRHVIERTQSKPNSTI